MSEVFKRDFRVSSYEINPAGKARLTTLANYLQEIAYEHATELGWGYHALKEKGIAWILSRMRIHVLQYPGWDEEVRVETWPRGIEKLFALRDFRIYGSGGELLAEATTYWLIVNTNTHRPMRMPEAFLDIVLNEEQVFEEGLEKILGPEELFSGFVHEVVYSDLDIVGHVNNVKYIEWCNDALDADVLKENGIRDLQINFMREARLGDRIQLYFSPLDKGRYYMKGVHAETDSECFVAVLSV